MKKKTFIIWSTVLISLSVYIWSRVSRARAELGESNTGTAITQQEASTYYVQTIRVGTQFVEKSVPWGWSMYSSNATPAVIIDVRVNDDEPQTLFPGATVKCGTQLRKIAFSANAEHNPPGTMAEITCWYSKVQ